MEEGQIWLYNTSVQLRQPQNGDTALEHYT